MLPKSRERKGAKNRKRKFREREEEECIRDYNAGDREIFGLSAFYRVHQLQ
jgi:hypothetical protein